MADRYRMALAQGTQAFERVVDEDAELLQHFGLRLLSVQSGVRAAVEAELKGKGKGKGRGKRIDPWNVMEINAKTWAWLRLLLVELRAARMSVDVEGLAAQAPE